MKQLTITVLSLFFVGVGTLWSQFCVQPGSVVITRPDNPGLNPNGPYCSGEHIEVCFSIPYFNLGGSGNDDGPNWSQAIIPRLGDGWDRSLSDFSSVNIGAFSWFDEGEVDYNFNSTKFRLYINSEGLLEMCHDDEPGCDNDPFIAANDILPGGWFAVSNGSAGCASNGDPDESWGFPQAPGSLTTISGCVDLYAKGTMANCSAYENLDYDFSIYVLTHRETGCWTSSWCGQAYPPIALQNEVSCECLGSPVSGNNDCPQDLTYNAAIFNSGNYEASNSIEILSSMVPNPNDVFMRAGTAISLNAGFEVFLGANYEAVIDDCGQ